MDWVFLLYRESKKRPDGRSKTFASYNLEYIFNFTTARIAIPPKKYENSLDFLSL